jgi:hypothetical protein
MAKNRKAGVFMITKKDKDLLLTIVPIFVSLGMFMLMVHLLGEVHGIYVLVIAFLVQISFLVRRVVALEREVSDLRKSADEGRAKIIEKTHAIT